MSESICVNCGYAEHRHWNGRCPSFDEKKTWDGHVAVVAESPISLFALRGGHIMTMTVLEHQAKIAIVAYKKSYWIDDVAAKRNPKAT